MLAINCVKAITANATKKSLKFSPCPCNWLSVYSPNDFRLKTTTVVESAIAAALKKTVIFLLQKRHDEQKASIAAKTIAISPPYKINARKIKVSETEMCDLNLGISNVIREPNPIVKQKRIRK